MKTNLPFLPLTKLFLVAILLIGFGKNYHANAALSGVYTINGSLAASATNYQSFIAAITDMRLGTRLATDAGPSNGAGVSGPVIFNVAAGTYTGQIEITAITGVSATNTITFDGGAGNAATRIITNSTATSVATAYTVRINNLQYVTLRNLTILASNASFAWPLHIMNLAHNTKVKNCIIGFGTLASTHTTTNFCAVVVNNSTASPTTATAAITNVEIDSNSIYGGYGNYIVGSGTASNINFKNNIVESTNYYGLYVQGVNKFSINYNKYTLLELGNIGAYGLYINSCAAGTGFAHEIIGNNIVNAAYQGIYISSSAGQSATRSVLLNNSLGGGFRNTNAYGIYFAGSSYNWNIYHNSVNLDAVTVNTQNAAFFSGNCCTTGATLLDVRNNVFAVTGVGSTAYGAYFPNGYSYAVINTASFDYNLFYKVGISNQEPLLYNGGTILTPSNFIGNSSYNTNSIYANPNFTSAKNLLSFNPCYNGTSIAGITTDINGTTRSLTTPDIGAYEVNGVANDVGIESMVTPALPFSPGSQDITVKLRNYGSNAITAANVSYTVNGGTPIIAVFTGSIAACATANYTFTSQYNFVANTPYNIKVYTELPNSTQDANTINDTVTIPLIYTGLSGNYTIDQSLPASATNFVSFTSAANALNNGGISGPVNFTVMGTTPYNEQVSLNFIPGVSSTNTITFDGGVGNAANRILTFAATVSGSNHTFKINNTPWVTIKNLTIRGTGASFAWPVHVSGNSSSNITISNCIVNFIGGGGVNGTSDNFTAIVLNGGSASLNTGATFSNLYVDSNIITGGNSGIYFYTQNSADINARGNTITGANMYGIYAYYLTAFRINYNTIEMRVTGSASSMGIYANFPISNGAYGKEIIGNIVNNAGQYGINCYYMQGSTGNLRGKVINNAVGGTFRSTDPAGIYFNNYTLNIDVFFNSVNLGNAATGVQSAAFKMISNCTGNIVKNNNFAVTNVNSSAYAVWSDNTSIFSALNYNNYYKPILTKLLNISNVVYSNTSMVGVSGYNLNAVSTNPNYTSATNLQSSLACSDGENISAVTTDLLGNLRGSSPDIGAFEYTATVANDLAVMGLVQPQVGTQNFRVLIKNNGNSTITSATVSYAVNGGTPQVLNWTGLLNACDTAYVEFNEFSGPGSSDQRFTFLPGTSYTITANSTLPNGSADLNTANDLATLGPICAALAGVYTIDGSLAASATNFTSIISAGQALTCAGITGPVVFNIAAGTYTGQVNFGDILGVSSTNTITFDGGAGNNATRILTFAATASIPRHTVFFNNASYINMRNLTILGTGASYGWPVHVFGSSNNITIANCIIELVGSGYSSTSTNFIPVVMSGSQSLHTTTGTFNNINLLNNSLLGGTANLYVAGNGTNTNIVVKGNIMTNSNTYGTYVSNVIGAKFIGNTINVRASSTTSQGMYFTSAQSTALGYTEISKNKIFNAGQYGIYITGSSATVGRAQLSNNAIGGVMQHTTPSGIHFLTSNNWDVWFNSVLISNTPTSTTAAAAVYLGSGTGFDFRNNNMFVADSNAGATYVPFRSNSGVTFTPALNYNNYYRAGTPTTLINVNGTNYSPATYNSIAGANSVSNSSGFTTGTELIPTLSTNNGIQIAGITSDINDSLRNNPPDIGAYEIASNYTTDLGIATVVSPNIDLTVGANTFNVLVKNYGATTITSFNIRHTVNGLNMQDSAFTGVSIAPNDTMRVILSGNKAAYVYGGVLSTFKGYIHLPNGSLDNNAINDTVVVGPFYGKLNGTYTINASGSGASNFTSFSSATTALNTAGVSGPVTFIVAAGTYNEQVNINTVTGASIINTITFDGVDASTRTITAASNTTTNYWTVKLNSAPYITLKNLTINATGATYGVAVQIFGTSSYSKIQKCSLNITTGIAATTNGFTALLVSNATTVTSPTISSKVDYLTIDSNTINGGYYGILLYGSTSAPYSTQNIISNNTINNSYYYGFYAYYHEGLTIIKNNVNMRLTGTNNSTGLYFSACINNLSGTYHNISGNKIIDAGNYGLYMSSGGGTAQSYITNNMIGGGFRLSSSYGMYITSVQNLAIYHNTVYNNFVTTGTQYAALYMNSNTNAEVKNNILSSTGTGLPLYAININGSFDLNGNNYYRFNASGGSDLIYIANTSYNISNYVGAGGYNLQSVSLNPGFISGTDLHITSPCTGKVARLGSVLTDIDGNARSLQTNIGADEGFGGLNDVGITSIQPFMVGAQDIRVVMQNLGSNTVTSANVYYSVNGGATKTISWSGTLNPCDTVTVVFSGANQFTFLSGVTYTIRSYTASPNLSSDTKTSNDTSILGPTCVFLSGNYTINASGSGVRNFTTFTQAVAALSCGGVSGPVNFIVAAGTYTEQFVINNIPGASAVNTVTFDGGIASNSILDYNPTLTTAGFTVKFEGASYVTFRNLTIRSSGTSGYGGAVQISSNCSSIRLVNNILEITGAGTTSASQGYLPILISASTAITSPSVQIVNTSNIEIDSNRMISGYAGVYLYGNSSTYTNNIFVRNNVMDSSYQYGSYVLFADKISFESNTINMRVAGAASSMGINLSNINAAGSNVITIVGNKIYNAGQHGIYTSFASTNNSLNRSNMINNVVGGNFRSTISAPLYMQYSNYWNVWHNTFVLNQVTTGEQYSAGYFTNCTQLDVRNNHFINTAIGGSGLAFFAAATNQFTTLNFNNYFNVSGANVANIGGVPYTPTTILNGGGLNANPQSTNPGFASAFNLSASNACINGVTIAAVTTDITAVTRNLPPDIGAYEFTGSTNNDIGISALINPIAPFAPGSYPLKVRINNYGANTITSATIKYSINNAAPVTYAYSGSLAPCDTATITISPSDINFVLGTSYSFVIWTELPNGQTDSKRINDTITAGACPALAGGNYTINPAGSGPSNFISFTALTNVLNCGGIVGAVNFTVSPGTYTEQVALNNINGASATNTITFDGVNKTTTTLQFNPTDNFAAYTFRILNTPYVTVKNLTLVSLGASLGNTIHIMGNCNNVNIVNNNITFIGNGQTSTSSYYIGVLVNNETNIYNPSSTGTKANNITIDSNNINYGYYGVMVNGFTSSPYSDGFKLRSNKIDSSYYYGVYNYYLSGITLTSNTVNMRSGNASSQGISLNFSNNNTGSTHNVMANKIKGAGMYGIYMSNATNLSTNRGSLINNSIAGGFSSTSAAGIYIFNTSSYWNVWHNSVWLDVATTSPSASSALTVFSNSNFLDIKNNHFVYSATTGSGLAFYYNGTPTAINNNNYFNASSTTLMYVNANYTSSTYVNGGGYNANSTNINPNFSIVSGLNAGGCYKGAVLGITTDINGKTRAATPDMGAFESAALDLGIVSITAPTQPVSAGLQNVAVLVKNLGGSTINAGTATYNVNNTSNVTQTFTGLTILPCSTATLTFSTQYNFPAGRANVKVYTENPNSSLDDDRTNDTLTSNLCGPLVGNYTINPNITSATNFVSFNEALSSMVCAGITGAVTFDVAPGIYNEQVTIPVISGLSASNPITFTGDPLQINNTVLTFSSNNSNARHTLKIDSAKYVTVKYLTIRTEGATFGWGVHIGTTSKFNTIKGCVIDIAGATAPTSTSTNFEGIVFSGSNTNPTTSGLFTDLTIDSNQINNGYYGVVVYGNTGNIDSNIVITNNKINNAYYYGTYIYSVEGIQFNNNNISNRIGNANSQGLYLNSSTAYSAFTAFEVNANRITNVGSYGIYLTTSNGIAGKQAQLYNNMIGGGFQGSNATGLYMNSSSNWDVYHNSINLDFATNGINYACVYMSGTITNINMKNNHFAYTALGGTGICVYNGASNPFAAGGFNYNNYYKVGIAATDNIIYNSGYYAQNNFIGGGGFNANSFSRLPGFKSNLDLATVDGCFNGTSLGVLVDIDGETRAALGDIGADEVSDANNDLGVVTLLEPITPLTPGLKDIKVTVKNYGTNTVTKGTVNYSINGGTPVSLVFNATILPCDTMSVTFTGANQFNFVSGQNYNIKTYTTAPNDLVDVNNINDTFISPSLCMSLAGTYSINPAGSGVTNYASFQAAIDALACSGVSGPVVFEVAAGTYTEQLVVPAIAGASATNTVTFNGGTGNAATRILTFANTTTNARQTVRFAGAQFVTFSNLTIRNSGTSWAWPVHIFSGSKSIGLKNNIIEITGVGATTPSTNFINVVESSSFTSPSSPLRVDSITIDSNVINGGYASVYSYNQQSTFNNFNGNTFNNPLVYGLYLYNAYELKFRNNLVNMSATGDITSVGLYLFVLGTVNNTVHEITGNKITNAGQYGINIYASSGSVSNPSLIVNNFIGGGFRNTTQHAGIYAESASYWNIWFNTINLDAISSAQFGALHAFNASNLNVRNNIFAVTNAASNAIPFYAATTSNTSQLNYNNYYKAGSSSTLIYNGVALPANGFIGVSGANANSFSRDPLFVSNSDLHVGNGCNNGITIATVTTDIDGQTRLSPPDVGAAEVTTGLTNNIGVVQINSPSAPLSNGSSDVVVVVSNLGNNLVTSANISYSVNGGTPTTINYTGSIAPCDTAIITFTGAQAFNFTQGTQYTIKAYTSLPNGVNDNNLVDDTTTMGPLCTAMSGNYTVDVSGSGPNNFASINAALSALQCAGISDDVVFTIANGTYAEQLVIGNVSGTNDTNTVSFVGQSKNGVIITFAANDVNAAHTIKINSAPYITISNLTIQSTGATMGVPLHIFGGSNKVKIKNNNILISGAGANSTSNYLIPVLINGSGNVSSPFTGVNINNLEIDSNTLRGGYYGIYIYGSTSYPYSNQVFVRNNNIDSSYYNGIYAYFISGFKLNANTFNMRVLGTTSSVGISFQQCNNNTGFYHQVNNNQIYDAGTSGFNASNTHGTNALPNEFYNNMVGGSFRATGARPVYLQGANYWNIYHNSINLNYATNDAQYSALSITTSSNARVVNNILAYTAASGTGLPFYTSTGQTAINYNNYLNATTSNLVYISGATYNTSNYINGGGFNANGFNVATGFTSNRNLFLTVANAKGDATLGITTDIEGQLRQTPPDIGADELAAPTITSFTPTTASSGATVTITGTGFTNATAVRFGGTNATSFTIVSGTGITAVVASGTSGVVTVVTPSGTATSAGNFTFVNTLNGIYTVGAGQTYSTIAAAISDLNASAIGGAVTFNVVAGHTETFASLTAGLVTATGTLTKPIVFQKSGGGANPVITASTGVTNDLDGIITISGGDYITFNGIDVQENASNTNSTTQMEWGYAILKSSATDGAKNTTIKNCNVVLNKDNTSSKGIYVNNHTPISISDLALNNLLGIHENILIQYNTVSNAYEPIHATGNATPAYYDVNLVIANNTVSDYNGSSITSAGIATYYQSAPVISANFISGSLGGTNELFGILSNTSPNTIIRANSITNLSADLAVAGIVTVDAVSLIENNKITNITTTSEDYEATGIIKSGAANASTIYNNRIANINAPNSTRPLGVRGMYMEGLVNVYHNTIYLNCTTGGSGFGSSCIFSSTDEVQVMRNNVLYNASTKGDVKALTRSTGNLSTYNASSNYNLFYAGVPSATNLIYASHDNTHQVQTLSAFRTLLADNRDLNSYSETMQFVGVDSLRPAANNYKLGASIVGFEYDIAGVLRSTPPDIGAYEGREANRWIGGTSNVWNILSNWDDSIVPSGTVPINIDVAAVNSPVLIGNLVVTDLNLPEGKSMDINGKTLTIDGDVIGDGMLKGGATSSLIINGTGNGLQLKFDSSAARLKNLTINRGTSPLSGGVVLANRVGVLESVTLVNGTLNANGNLILLSDSTFTAYIGSIPATADVIGNVTAQRYVPAVTRRSRLLASPLQNYTHAQLLDNIFITGTGGVTNGFDASPSNGNTIYTYQESTVGGRGWKPITNITNTLNPAQGATVFVRGDRSLTNWWSTPYPAQNKITLDFANQPINKGNVSPVITYTNTGFVGDDGWNLIGNPYPSPINWQNVSKTNLSPFYYSFDVVSGSYVAGLGDTLIASGQAFFVQATGANPTITFTENSKSTSAPRNYFKSSNSKMNVRMVKDAFNSDLLSIVFAQGADSNFQAMEDAIKMTNSVVNFSSMVNNDSLRLQYNTRPLLTSNTDTIKLYADAANGTYSFNFDGIQTVNNAYSVILLDAFTNSTVNLRLVSNYTFSITSSAASKGASRFKIIFIEVGALPVQLASFEGQKVGVDAKLKWTTASENNSNYFVVERSFDKKLWQELGLVNAKGNSSVLNVYGFTDVNAFETPALCYYRLKQVDKNNASTYSQIIVLDTKAASTEIVVYPTPTRNLLNIKTNTENANVLIELSDAMGKLVLQKSLVKNGNEVQLDMSDLRVGVYLLKYTEDGVVTIKKVIKQ